jgi:hypothetical protein
VQGDVRKILEYLLDHNEITSPIVAQIINKTPKTGQRLLRLLSDLEILQPLGADKNRRYIFAEKLGQNEN